MTTGVVVDFNANLARFTSGVDKAISDLNKFQSHTQRITANVNTALGAIGIGLSGAGFVAIVKGSIDAQDRLNDLRASTQLTIETLTGLDFAAKVSGGDLESIAGSVNKLAQNMGKDAEKFKALGISAKDPIEAFKQLADIFVAIQDPQLRAATGAEALGKGWAGAAPLLMEGSLGIGELIEKGTALSGITSESAKQADAFNDKWTELFGTGKVLNTVVGSALPLFNALADDMIKARKETGALDNEFKPLLETGKAVAVLFGNVAFVFKAVGTEIGGIAAQAAAIGRGDLSAAQAIGEAMKEDAVAARTSFDQWEARILDLGTQAGGASGAIAQKARDAALEARATVFAGSKDGKDSKDGKSKYKRDFDPDGDFDFRFSEMRERALRAGFDARDKQAADQVERLNNLLAATPTGQLEKAREEMQFLAAALEKGNITEEQFLEVTSMRLEAMTGKGKDAFDGLSQAVESWGNKAADTFAEFAVTGKASFGDLVNSMLMDIARLQAKKMLDPITKGASDWLGGAFSSGLGGLFGGGAAASEWDFGPSMPDLGLSFAGGGYTGGGPRSGGLDGQGGFMAMLHPQESVIDHARSGGGGTAPDVIINLVNQTGQPATARQQGAPSFDGSNWVISVIMEAAGSNPGFRAAMGLGR